MSYEYEILYIAMILLVGTLISVFAYSIKVSDVFLLLLGGMLLGNIGILHFQTEFITIASILALIFLVFNGCLAFKFGEVKKYFYPSMKLTLVTLLLYTLTLTFAAMFIFNLDFSFESIIAGFLLAVLAYGTDPSAVLAILNKTKNKFTQIIEIEAIVNTPILLIISFLLINSLSVVKKDYLLVQNPAFSLFMLVFVAIIVAGIAGTFVIAVLKRNYMGELTHLAVLTSAIIVYSATEFFGGSGVVAIAIYGLMFGNSHVSHLIEIERFESILTNSIKIITFMLLGTIFLIKPEYIEGGVAFFILSIILRFVSALMALRKEKVKIRQAIFIALNVPKGIDVALVVILIISLHPTLHAFEIITNVAMVLILFSMALSSICLPFANKLLGGTHVKKVQRN